MKKNICFLFVLLLIACGNNKDRVTIPEGKEIYIPEEFAKMDFKDPESKWSYHRMACTENFAIFWEKGFGPDLANPPALEGKSMAVDLQNLEDKLERFYAYYRDVLKFTKPGSKSEKYRMMVMINYSLEGTAYGGSYDNVIGALWVAPNRIQDERLNCIAHELGHSFQSQIMCDGEGEAWGGCGFFEMTSQWMLWQVNPEWITDEKYHWEAYISKNHKAYLHFTNIYHSPYVLEYWSMKHGLPVIGELFRQGKKGDDPVITYKEVAGLTQTQFCDEMFDACRRQINMDFDRVWDETRLYTNQFKTKLNNLSGGWNQISTEQCPENYGFNAIELEVPPKGTTVSADFKGLTKAEGYTIRNSDKAGWRYGFVAVTEEGKSLYGTMEKASEGKASLTLPTDKSLSHLWFVVMGAPAEHWMNPQPRRDETPEADAQWPYKVKFNDTKLK